MEGGELNISSWWRCRRHHWHRIFRRG